MSTHNLCFGAKIRKIGKPLHTPVLPYKGGVYERVYISRTFFLMKIKNEFLLEQGKH